MTNAPKVRLLRPVPILLTVRELDLGGIEHDVTKIAIHIDRSRFEAHVASYYAQGLRYEELRDNNIPILDLPVRSLASTGAAKAALKLWRYIKRHKIQLVHAYDPSVVFVAPLARVFHVPAVVSSQLGSRSRLDRRSLWQVRRTDRMVDAVIVNCEAMRNELVGHEGVPNERIRLCYNGVDTRKFFPAPAAKPDRLSDASLVIGTICVLRAEKALEVLQEAFARIRHLDSRMRLLIVGSGPELPKLQTNSRRLGLEDVSVFIPATSEVAKFLRSIDIFVSSSYSEAFSNSILEAMACGCCVVGSHVGGTPELIGGDARGMLFPVGDAVGLAERLRSLISNEELRRRLATRAAEFAKNHLSIEIAAGRMADIYGELLLRKGRGGSGQHFDERVEPIAARSS